MTDVLVRHNEWIFFPPTKVSQSNPVKTPEDRLLLNLGSGLYKVCPDPDALLPHLIKNIPSLLVVYNQKIKINVNTLGQTLLTNIRTI